MSEQSGAIGLHRSNRPVGGRPYDGGLVKSWRVVRLRGSPDRWFGVPLIGGLACDHRRVTANEDRPVSSDERGVAQHIFIVSAAMVGVCLTLLGLVGIIA